MELGWAATLQETPLSRALLTEDLLGPAADPGVGGRLGPDKAERKDSEVGGRLRRKGWCWLGRRGERQAGLQSGPLGPAPDTPRGQQAREQTGFSDSAGHRPPSAGSCGNTVPWGPSGAQEVPKETRDQRAACPGHSARTGGLSGSCSLGWRGWCGLWQPSLQKDRDVTCTVFQEGTDCRGP